MALSPRKLFRLTAHVVAGFKSLDVPYMVGGSLASSTYGTPRLTQDVDLVADLPSSKAGAFAARLGDDFYCDTQSIRDAVRHKRSFNILHPKTAWKFDVFTVKDSVFSRGAFARRIERSLAGSAGKKFWVCTPEDVILEKLMWFKSGGEVSERQWGDILGVLKLSARRLDHAYLARWAESLGVFELLQRAQAEAHSK